MHARNFELAERYGHPMGDTIQISDLKMQLLFNSDLFSRFIQH